MTSLTQSAKNELIKFKQKADEFMRSLNELEKRESEARRYPQFSEQYDDLIGRSWIIRKTVGGITAAINKVVEYFDIDLTPENNLGAIQLIPIAAIVAAVAAMGKWGSDVYIFNKRLSEVQRLESKGLSPAQAAEIAIKAPVTFGESIGDNLLRPLVPIIGLGIVGYLFFKYQEGKNNGR